MELIKLENNMKITSNMISELTGKEHNTVMRDIRKIIENIGIEECCTDLYRSTYISKNNQPQPNYAMTHDGLMLIITKYSDVHRMKLIKYCRELETKPKTLSFAELLQQSTLMLKELNNKNIVLENKIKEDEHRVSFAETIEKASDSILIRDLSKILGNEGIKLGQNKLYEKLREYGYICKNSTMPTQRATDQKLFYISERVVKTVKGNITSLTTKITGKGQVFLLDKIKKEEAAKNWDELDG